MQSVQFKSKNGQNITISAVINFPQGFEESKKYPAIGAAHPGGGVKEQTAGLYARKLAEKGSFVHRPHGRGPMFSKVVDFAPQFADQFRTETICDVICR